MVLSVAGKSRLGLVVRLPSSQFVKRKERIRTKDSHSTHQALTFALMTSYDALDEVFSVWLKQRRPARILTFSFTNLVQMDSSGWLNLSASQLFEGVVSPALIL